MALYTDLAPTARDVDGAVMADECDSWHFTALQGAVIGGVNTDAFLGGGGKLHRRPESYPECWPENSESESSKEMYLYGALYALAQKDRAWAEDRFEYGAAHQWVMGRGQLSRTLLTLNGRAALAQVIEALGGHKYPDRLWTPPRLSGLTGFDAFIQAVGITFEGLRFGAMSSSAVGAVDEQAVRSPRNAMYACLAARWGHGSLAYAQDLLLDETIFPALRLPTSDDYCERWITQRDDTDSGWQPCNEGKTHPPGPFLLAAAICQGAL